MRAIVYHQAKNFRLLIDFREKLRRDKVAGTHDPPKPTVSQDLS
jgi:hypothetical protein